MPELFSDAFKTTLTTAITVTTRPVTFSVASTSADLAGGTFSIIIYDAGTDANPVNAEILKVNDGSTTSWTATNETGHPALTHASGSAVRLVLTRRSLTQQMTDHTVSATTPDPHTQYLRKASFTAKGSSLVGTGVGTFTSELVGADGTTIIADSTQTTGRRWAIPSFASVITHVGDLVIGAFVSGVSGVASRLGIGTIGQVLTVAQNAPAVANPTTGPSVAATGTGGALVNGTSYDFAYAWSTGVSPDGGTTLASSRTSFTATVTGVAAVTAPAAPSAGLTLIVYASLAAGALQQQVTLPNASTSTTNTINVSSIAAGVAPNTTNTTGGIGPVWSAPSFSNPMTALNDLIVGATAGAPTRLAAGAVGTILSIASGPVVAWSRAVDVMTAVGDLITGGTTGAPTRLAPGASGTFLQSNGPGIALTWATPTGGGGGSGGGGSSSGLVPISTVTPSGVGSVTFSVPTGFRNLQIKGTTRVATGANGSLGIQFNGDTGLNYFRQHIFAQQTTLAADQALQPDVSGNIATITGSASLANSATSFVVTIPNHTGTTFFKTWVAHAFGVLGTLNTSSATEVFGGFWANTAAVTSVTVILDTNTFAAGTTITLWGESDVASGLLTTNSNLISETILTASQATISIPNISQAYRDLRVVVEARSDAAAVANIPVTIQFNGDTGANYDWTRHDLVGAFNFAQAQATTSMQPFQVPAATSPTSVSGHSPLFIPSYSKTDFQKEIGSYGVLKSGITANTQFSEIGTGWWRNTAAITSITLGLTTGNFVAGSVVRVYGEPASSGGPSVGTGTRLRTSANQSIPAATATIVNWDTEDNDADNQHFNSAAALTGTVAKTAGSATLTGTGTSFTTELSVGQVISVPGVATEQRVVIAVISATSLTVSNSFSNTATGQTASRINSAVVFRQPGFFTLEANLFMAAVATGGVTVQYRLNGTTMLGQRDPSAINASAGYELILQRNFQMWDYVEIILTQSSAAAVNLLTDERTHWSISGRPTVIVAIPYVNIQEQQPSGTASQGTFTLGAYRTRTLNTIVSDSAGIASLTTNQITLPPGTYRYSITSPTQNAGAHKARLQNITDAVTIQIGTTENNVATSVVTHSIIRGKVTLTGTKVLEVQHRLTTSGGGGPAATFGDTEVYTVAEFWKEG